MFLCKNFWLLLLNEYKYQDIFIKNYMFSFFKNFSFVKNRKKFYIISGSLFLFSILSPFILPVHQGIDLTGWIQIEYNISNNQSENVLETTKSEILKNVKSELSEDSKKIITDTIVYAISWTENIIVEAGIDESEAKNSDGTTNLEKVDNAKNEFVNKLQEKYNQIENTQITQIKYVNIGASFGQYIKNSGYLTLTLAVIGISVYIMYAFSGAIPGIASWPFAIVTALSLLHDVVISFGLYIVASAIWPEFKIDTFFFTAMLTVLGYSINDTIVILDKVRSTISENKKSDKNLPLAKIIDNAIHSTMRRSLFTSFTIFVVLIAMFIFGPSSIVGFVLILIFGVIVGTYSSVFLAAPALVNIVKENKNP